MGALPCKYVYMFLIVKLFTKIKQTIFVIFLKKENYFIVFQGTIKRLTNSVRWTGLGE